MDSSASRTFETTETGFRIRRMRLILLICLLDTVPGILVILFYLGVNHIQLVNINQLLMFVGVVAVTRCVPSRAAPFIAFAGALVFISLINTFFITEPSRYSFQPSAIMKFYYSIFMPVAVFISIYSQNNATAKEVLKDLRWFSKWFLIIATPIIIAYAILHFTGRIVYFGFGLNFHYVTPYFVHRGGVLLFIAALILVSGKRAVLVNFLAQLALFKLGQFRRSFFRTLLILLPMIGLIIASWDFLEFFLRRIMLMVEVLQRSDLSNGLLDFANTYEAIVLFGGRLEEIVGVVEYFNQSPEQIWFGSPPGAQYIWRVEISDMETAKSYAHLTWIGYVFRFGIIPTMILLSVFIYRLVKGWDSRNPLWLVFFGILVSAMFGANLFYSPVAWVMVALYFRFGSEISREIRRESPYSS